MDSIGAYCGSHELFHLENLSHGAPQLSPPYPELVCIHTRIVYSPRAVGSEPQNGQLPVRLGTGRGLQPVVLVLALAHRLDCVVRMPALSCEGD